MSLTQLTILPEENNFRHPSPLCKNKFQLHYYSKHSRYRSCRGRIWTQVCLMLVCYIFNIDRCCPVTFPEGETGERNVFCCSSFVFINNAYKLSKLLSRSMIIFLEPFPRCEVVQSKDTQIFEGFWNEFPNCSSERPCQFNDLALVLYSISYYFSIPRPSFVIETYFPPIFFLYWQVFN